MRNEPTLDPARVPELRVEPRPPPRRRLRPGRVVAWLLLGLFLAPPAVVLALKWVPPPTSAFMLQSKVKPVRYRWVPATEIAEAARRAVIAAEDQKFRVHNGFDLEAIEKALAHNQKSRRRRGASTISQQTAKNLFLWPGGGYFRKAVEATFTVLIEWLWGKDRILEVYLNVAEFGPGIYGVEAASQAYFGKPAKRLEAHEAARLAAVLPNPRKWSARAPGPYVQSRVGWILGQMSGRRRGTPVAEDDPEPVPFGEETAPEPEEDEFPADVPVEEEPAPPVVEPEPVVDMPPAEELPEPVPIAPDEPAPGESIPLEQPMPEPIPQAEAAAPP